MANNDRIGRLARQLGERLQDASHAPEEIQRSVQSVMRGAFDRMELVSREDFDILMDVLQRTRTRVEALEKQVAALEAALDDEVSAPVSPAVVAADTAAPPADAEPTHREAGPGGAKQDNEKGTEKSSEQGSEQDREKGAAAKKAEAATPAKGKSRSKAERTPPDANKP